MTNKTDVFTENFNQFCDFLRDKLSLIFSALEDTEKNREDAMAETVGSIVPLSEIDLGPLPTSVGKPYLATALEKVIAAWDGFPGRSCAEAEWNAWVLRMNRRIDEDQRSDLDWLVANPAQWGYTLRHDYAVDDGTIPVFSPG